MRRRMPHQVTQVNVVLLVSLLFACGHAFPFADEVLRCEGHAGLFLSLLDGIRPAGSQCHGLYVGQAYKKRRLRASAETFQGWDTQPPSSAVRWLSEVWEATNCKVISKCWEATVAYNKAVSKDQ